MSHKNLDVWKKSITLVKQIYDVTELFPKQQQYSLTQQMQRAAVSIPSNIAEGSARGSKKDYIRFLHIARGSVAELDTQIIIAFDRRYFDQEAYENLCELTDHIGKMLTKLIYSLQT